MLSIIRVYQRHDDRAKNKVNFVFDLLLLSCPSKIVALNFDNCATTIKVEENFNSYDNIDRWDSNLNEPSTIQNQPHPLAIFKKPSFNSEKMRWGLGRSEIKIEDPWRSPFI